MDPRVSGGRICPNRHRSKRTGLGGGSPNCRGHLQVRLLVSVSVGLKSWGRKGSRSLLPQAEEAVPARVLRSGVRIPPRELLAAYLSGNVDIACDTCGWSVRRLSATAKALTRRRRVR